MSQQEQQDPDPSTRPEENKPEENKPEAEEDNPK